MIEYTNGTFSEIFSIEEFKSKFLNILDESLDDIRSLHFGTIQELEDKKSEIKLKERVSKIEKAIEELNYSKSLVVHIPTNEEFKKYGG